MLHWIAQNTLVAAGIAVLATIVSLACRRRPAAGHILWVCVLAALLAPPLPKLGPLDGRAHAQRLAERVGRGWSGLLVAPDRTGPAAHGTPHSPRATPREASVPAAPALDRLLIAADEPIAWSTDAAPVRGLEQAALGDWETSPAAQATPHPTPRTAVRERAGARPAAQGPASAELATPRSNEARAAAWWPRVDWRAVGVRTAVLVWLFGAAWFAVRLGRDLRGLHRLCCDAAEPGAELAADIRAAAEGFGIRPPRVRVSANAPTPFVCGLVRPTLVWPESQDLGAPGARAVLAHELAHLARRDHWIAWIEALAACVLWWHPLAHLARAQMRRLAERACDAWVVWAHPDSRRDYADALLDAVERLRLTRRPLPALGAVDSDKRTLARRLVMIMNGNVARRSSRALAICAIALTAALSPTWATAARREAPTSFARLGDIDRALRPIVEAAKLGRLADAYAQAEEWDHAIGAYNTLAALRPDDAGVYYDLAMALYNTERYADAAQAFHKGAELVSKQGARSGRINGVRVNQAVRNAQKVAEQAKVQAATQRKLAAKQLAIAADQRVVAREQLAKAAEKAAKARARVAEIKPEIAKLRALKESADAERNEAEIRDVTNELESQIAEAMDGLPDEQFGEDIAMAVDESLKGMDVALGSMNFDDMNFGNLNFGGFTTGAGGSPSDWVYNEACCLALAGQTDAALDALGRAIALGYDSADHATDDSDLESLHNAGRFKDLIASMQRLNELSNAGEENFDDEQWQAAAEAFGDAANIADRSPGFRHMFAFASLRAGDAQAALEGWTRALELGSNKPTALYNIACANAAAGRTGEALGSLSRAVDAGFSDHELLRTDADLDPIRAEAGFDALLKRVVARAKLQREIQTAAEFDEWSEMAAKSKALLDQSPADSWEAASARTNLAMALLRSGDYAGAESAFRDAALAGSGPANELYNIACCRALGGDMQGALDYLNAAVDSGYQDAEHMQADEDLAPVHDAPGFAPIAQRAADAQVLMQFGVADWNQLLERAKRQIAESPEDGSAYLQLGWALLRTDRAAEAIGAFQKQAELDYLPAIGRYNIACCHAVLGHTDDAFDALKRAVAAGFGQFELMATDPDLKSLRKDPRFQKLLSSRSGDIAPEPTPQPALPNNKKSRI